MITLFLSDIFFHLCILAVLAENGRLKHIDAIAKRFAELTMAHKGELKATVTTVIVSPPIGTKSLHSNINPYLSFFKFKLARVISS